MSSIQHTMIRPQIELKCHVDCSMLGILREFVCCVARHFGFTEEQIAEIEISVDEACANAMEHAYPTLNSCKTPDPDCVADVLLEITFSDDAMIVRIVDFGSGTSAVQQPENTLESYLKPEQDNFRGLGLLLIKKFMDKVDIQSAPGHGTTVQMTKFRTRK